MIKKLKIKNFKCFKDWFELDLNNGLNILVGNNEEGKSTIMEAIHLALTGYYRGNYIGNELSQYLFNKDVVNEYLKNIKENKKIKPPEIIIELYLDNENAANLEGSGNSTGSKVKKGIVFKILFDNSYENEYYSFIENDELNSLPIEYYKIEWMGFNREKLTTRSIPTKSFLIDNSSFKYNDGSDKYISNMIKGTLTDNELIKISKAFRKTKDNFGKDDSVKEINKKISKYESIFGKKVSIGVNLGRNANWESSVVTEFDNIPYSNAGRGIQCLVKTDLAIKNTFTNKEKILLIEEPENHLSYSNMNKLVDILNNNDDNNNICNQKIISTHSNFLLNKLGLDNLILVSNKKSLKLTELSDETKRYFKAIPGFDTLRVLLCDKAILVEGPSDELIIQKAYIDEYKKLPIFDGIDVISVGTAFLRFLELGTKLDLNLFVVTDNDGNIDGLKNKYKDYENYKNIKIYYDKEEYKVEMNNFNYNTLEPCMLRANGREILNKVFGRSDKKDDELLKYMKKNKTKCAICIFDNKEEKIKYPDYINEVINDVHE